MTITIGYNYKCSYVSKSYSLSYDDSIGLLSQKAHQCVYLEYVYVFDVDTLLFICLKISVELMKVKLME